MPGGKETNVHHNHLKPVKLRERDGPMERPTLFQEGEKRREYKDTRNQVPETNIIRDEKGQLPSFAWMPCETAAQPAEPTGYYSTRYGRESRPPVRYPDP